MMAANASRGGVGKQDIERDGAALMVVVGLEREYLVNYRHDLLMYSI
ncbi:MAG: hypothetical protein ACJARU_001998 [Congregibacter sp.]|jgi:hypothetical protein